MKLYVAGKVWTDLLTGIDKHSEETVHAVIEGRDRGLCGAKIKDASNAEFVLDHEHNCLYCNTAVANLKPHSAIIKETK